MNTATTHETVSTYNGWTNYATWRVNLEIVDDYVNSLDGEKFDSIEAFAIAIEEEVDEALTNYGEIEDGLAIGYAHAFLSDVNWYEIAEAHATDNNLIDSDEDDDN